MTAKEILIRIRAAFDRKPVNDAKQNLEQLGKAGSDAGKTGADGMNVMSAATAAMQGNLSGAANAISSLVGRVKLLGMSMLQLSLVAAVITSLIKLFQALADRASNIALNLNAIKSGNLDNALARITESYKKMTEESDRAESSRDRLFDVSMQELQAIQKLESAQRELNKQKELSAATTEKERAEIESKYKATAMERDKWYGDQTQTAQQGLMLDKAAKRQEAADKARKQIEEIMEILPERLRQTNYAQRKASEKRATEGTWKDAVTFKATTFDASQWEADAEKGREKVKDMFDTISQLQQVYQDNIEAATIYRKQSAISTIEQRSSDLGYKASSTALDTDDRMRAEREAARLERERLEREQEAMRSRIAAERQSRSETQSRLSERASRETAEADQYGAAAAAMRGRSGYNQANRSYQKERQDMVRAVKAAEDFAAETVRIMQQHEARIRAIAEAQKRIPNS